jgi:hypothetical protein
MYTFSSNTIKKKIKKKKKEKNRCRGNLAFRSIRLTGKSGGIRLIEKTVANITEKTENYNKTSIELILPKRGRFRFRERNAGVSDTPERGGNLKRTKSQSEY